MSIANSYFWHTTRVILHESRRSTSMKDLQSKLAKKGVKMDIISRGKLYPNYQISFKNKRGFSLDSAKGKDRIFTDKVRNNVQKVAEVEQSKAKELLQKPEYNRFAEIRKNRELNTSMQRGNMFNNKGLSR